MDITSLVLVFSLKAQEATLQTTQIATATPAVEDYFGVLPTLEQLLLENGGCELPCWWGFRIGEAKEDDWLDFLHENGFDKIRDDAPPREPGTIGGDSYFLSFGNEWHPIGFAFQRPGILTYLRIELVNPNKWLSPEYNTISLPRLLGRLDETPEIYMFLGGTSSPLSLPILVLNDEIGFMAQYTFNLFDTLETPNDADTWQFCLGLENTTGIEFTIQDPNAEQPVSHRIQPLIEAKEDPRWASIEDLNTTQHMSTTDFVQFFRDNPDKCLVPAEYIQQQQNQ